MKYQSFVILIMLLINNYSFSMNEPSEIRKNQIIQLARENINQYNQTIEVIDNTVQECDQAIQNVEREIEELHATELVKKLQFLQDSKKKMYTLKEQYETSMIDMRESEQKLKALEKIDQSVATLHHLDEQLKAINSSEQTPQEQASSLQNSVQTKNCYCVIS